MDISKTVKRNGRKEGNVLFNDALNTFYLRLYGVGHMVKNQSDRERGRKEMFYLTMHSTHFIYGYMVKNHSDRERGNPLSPHRLLFQISSKGSFICIIPQTGYHTQQPLLHQMWGTGWNDK